MRPGHYTKQISKGIRSMKVYLKWLALVATMILTGCGGGEGSGSSEKAADKLTIEDFEVKPVKISKSEFLDELSSIDSFFLNAPVNDTPNDSFDEECLNNIYNRFFFQMEDNGTFELLMPWTDISSCLLVENAGVSKFNVSSFSEKVIMFDRWGNSIDLEGKSLNNIEDEDYFTLQARNISSSEVHGVIEQEKYTIVTRYALTDKDSFDEPCLMQSPMTCATREVELVQSEYHLPGTQNTVLKTNVEFEDRNDTYFSNGTIEFFINDWNGTMVYSGASTQPTFSATNGIESVNGIFEYLGQ